jgi:multiple sugar transport system ATP-binding protein
MKAVPAGTDAALVGTIDVVEPTGPDTMVTAVIGTTAVIARVPPRFGGKRGEAVGFTVDPASVSLFDPKTEQRIAL